MNCPNCGQKIPDGSQVCPACQSGLAQVSVPGIKSPKTSGLAIASLVLGILGFLTLGLSVLPALILGVIAMFRIRGSQGRLNGMGFAIAGIATGAASMFFLLILAAIAIPNFLHSLGRARQVEAKENLSAIWTAEQAYLADHGEFAKSFSDLKWQPARISRYSYFLSARETIPATMGGPYQLPPGIEPFVGDSGFLIVAVGNLDRDDTLDVWSLGQDQYPTNVIDDVFR